ncbi:MAG: sensor histidine kinase [Clostridia bacterium]|nr:sensor histidine kinase [Clostridia bacterium]
MWQRIVAFSPQLDIFWFSQLAFQTLAWVILAQASPLKKHIGPRTVVEFFLLYAGVNAMTLLAVGFNGAVPGIANLFLLLRILGLSLATAGYMALFAAGRRKTRLILWLAMTTVSMSITHVGGQASMLVGRYIMQGRIEGWSRVVFDSLNILAAMYLRRFCFDDFPAVPSGSLWMLGTNTGCVLMFYIAEALLPMDRGKGVTQIFLLAYLAMLIMMLAMVYALYNLCRWQKTVTDLQAEKQRYLSEKEQTRVTEAMLQSLRAIRHDLKNQYAYMRILLADKRYTELEQYFADLEEAMPPQLNIVDCGNHTLNTVLNMEFSKLQSDKIKLEHQLIVPPVLPFRDEEMCSILTNLLDNAGDECRHLLRHGRDSAMVRLEIYPHQSYLYIRCLNTTDKTAIERRLKGLRTTKRDAELHGYGTQIIAKLAEKYNGLADYTIKDGIFEAKVMLDMTSEVKE